MFRLVVPLEAAIGYCDLSRDDEVISGCVEGPQVGTKNHDAERHDIMGVRVILHHAKFERIREIFAKTHV